jgi:HPt (histidine-containing phosphotransfer) domain-containing protein
MLGTAIDLNHLSRYTGGNESLNAEVLRLFETQTSELVVKLQSILEAADVKSWKEVTHTLKGAAKGVGAFSFAEAAAAAEPIDPSRDHESAARAMAQLMRNAEAVKRFVDSYLER